MRVFLHIQRLVFANAFQARISGSPYRASRDSSRAASASSPRPAAAAARTAAA